MTLRVDPGSLLMRPPGSPPSAACSECSAVYAAFAGQPLHEFGTCRAPGSTPSAACSATKATNSTNSVIYSCMDAQDELAHLADDQRAPMHDTTWLPDTNSSKPPAPGSMHMQCVQVLQAFCVPCSNAFSSPVPCMQEKRLAARICEVARMDNAARTWCFGSRLRAAPCSCAALYDFVMKNRLAVLSSFLSVRSVCGAVPSLLPKTLIATPAVTHLLVSCNPGQHCPPTLPQFLQSSIASTSSRTRRLYFLQNLSKAADHEPRHWPGLGPGGDPQEGALSQGGQG